MGSASAASGKREFPVKDATRQGRRKRSRSARTPTRVRVVCQRSTVQSNAFSHCIWPSITIAYAHADWQLFFAARFGTRGKWLVSRERHFAVGFIYLAGVERKSESRRLVRVLLQSSVQPLSGPSAWPASWWGQWPSSSRVAATEDWVPRPNTRGPESRSTAAGAGGEAAGPGCPAPKGSCGTAPRQTSFAFHENHAMFVQFKDPVGSAKISLY